MKIKQTRIILIIGILMVLPHISFGQAREKADKDTQVWRYEMEAEGVGRQGTYLVKVWSYSKSKNAAIEQVKKNAVHGAIFKGFPGKDGVPGRKALVTSPNVEEEKADYFNEFFADNGKYMKFVSLSGDGGISPGDRVHVAREYKIGIVVTINADALRQELEQAGIIRELGSGF